jgi:hypothetical protein
MARPIGTLLLAASTALTGPALAGAPFVGNGVHVVQADLMDCNAVTIDGAITLDASIPDDGRQWSWGWITEASDGANFAQVGDGLFGLLPTAGDVLLENTGSLLVGPSLPGGLVAPFDFTYTASTYADGVLVYESTITTRCEAGTATATVVESRLARPRCGPPVAFDACDAYALLPTATFKATGLDTGDARLSLKASGGPSDLAQFGDPSLLASDGGVTTATCLYDASDGLIGGLLADAGVQSEQGRPRWKRKASATKVAQKYADPKGEEGDPLRTLAQSAGAKTKLAFSARGMNVGAGNFTATGLRIQQRSVSPRDLTVACTEVYFPEGTIAIDAVKGVVKAKMKVPACGPGCP